MPKPTENAMRILCLLDVFQKHTDPNNGIKMVEIENELGNRGFAPDRQTIYRDIQALRECGYSVECQPKTPEGTKIKSPKYKLVNKTFDYRDIRFLIDCVQSSHFLSNAEVEHLTEKLLTLCSVEEAKRLDNKKIKTRRVKSMNNQVLENVDKIQQAIRDDKQVRFKRYKYESPNDKFLQTKTVSPYLLLYEDSNYYMFSHNAHRMLFYRVDRCHSLEVVEKSTRTGKEAFEKFDEDAILKNMFGMFQGTLERVKIKFDNRLITDVHDRFGLDINTVIVNAKHFSIEADIMVSPQFFGWMAGMSHLAVIMSPQWVIDEYADHIYNIHRKYKN